MTFLIDLIAYYERQGRATELSHAPAHSEHPFPRYVRIVVASFF